MVHNRCKTFMYTYDDDDDDDEVSGSVVMSRGHCVGTVDKFKCGLVAEVTE